MSKPFVLPAALDGELDPGPSGMELPEFLPVSNGPQAVERTFAFLDLSGFTAFTEKPKRTPQFSDS